MSWRFQLNILTFLDIWVMDHIWLLPADMGRRGVGVRSRWAPAHREVWVKKHLVNCHPGGQPQESLC
ncbi:hypothetical protein I79_012545 [Cricetulus griseus]|uniref:Uncharacterized protein n=1 Tax=Cricetulus griseus TaxID=10029 RepID=G3HP41_CRIGR|nr:hypothetical protein I79_012545 [Cricetulus griseus]